MYNIVWFGAPCYKVTEARFEGVTHENFYPALEVPISFGNLVLILQGIRITLTVIILGLNTPGRIKPWILTPERYEDHPSPPPPPTLLYFGLVD